MRFQVALLGFDADHDRLLRFHLAHTRGQLHEFTALGGGSPAGADIAVIDLDGLDLAASGGTPRVAPPTTPRIEVSSDGQRGSSAFRLARPDALASLPSQLHRVVDVGILSCGDAPVGPEHVELESAANDDGSTRPCRALVVDADAATRADLRAGLRRLGVACDELASAATMETALRQHRYDLLLLDAQADGGNSYALCRRLCRDPILALPPLVMLCGPGAPFDRARAALCGCAAHLPKPLPWSDFRRIVETFVRRPPRGAGGEAPKRRQRSSGAMASFARSE